MRNHKVFYVIFMEGMSGVLKGQVIDVVNTYSKEVDSFRLLMFVSIRNYFQERREIKKYSKDAIVVPAFPKLKRWGYNKFWFKYLLKKRDLYIGRGIVATNLLLISNLSGKIIYDGRGAVTAEQNEYNVFEGSGIEAKIRNLEEKSVLEVDHRIAVSQKLVEYWKEEFIYNLSSHTIIPCTLQTFNDDLVSSFSKQKNIKIVFSGALGKWQSFEMLCAFLNNQLRVNESLEVLLLTKEHPEINQLMNQFPHRIQRKWLKPEEVKNELLTCQYGVMLREHNITNRVASPVKFAEYLSAGLKVILSEGIGDFSELAKKESLGIVLDSGKLEIHLEEVLPEERKRIKKFAEENFIKEGIIIKEKYLEILSI